jgi:hypothetical protein
MAYPPNRISYEDIFERFEEFDCRLLTTKQEFIDEKLHSKSVFTYTAQCGHTNSSRYKALKEQPLKYCKKCVRQKNQIINYNRLKDRFEKIGLKLLTPLGEYIDNEMNCDSDCRFIALCGHERISTIYTMEKSEYRLCVKCVNEIAHENQRITYEVVEERFNEQGLTLITTEKEYEEKRLLLCDNITYIAQCGHERTSRIGSVLRMEQFECLKCTQVRVSKTLQENATTEDGIASGNYLEYQALCLLKENVQDVFEVKKLGCGTLADCAVRPLGNTENEWLPIQLKSTKHKNKRNIYSFDFRKKDYSGMIVICSVINDKRYFIYEGSEVKGKATIRISLNEKRLKKEYESEVSAVMIKTKLMKYYDTYTLTSYECLNKPLCKTHKRESEFIFHRETNLSFLPFEYPEIDNLVYDFTINNFKVQEKVCQIYHKCDNAIVSIITKNSKRKNGKLTRGPYYKGDNDFYWFHHPDKKMFYLIPEMLMLKWEKLKTEKTEGKRSIIFYQEPNILDNKMTKEAQDYLFNYDILDINKLKSIFNIE